MSKPIPNPLLDTRFGQLADFLDKINSKWKPHPRQKEIGRKIFVEGKRRIFVEAGRKFGKSEIAVDICWRLGNMIKNGQGYYFGAYQKAVREIIWASQRLQGFGPQDYVQDINKNDMRVTFTSGTFVKCDGADEFRISKGFTPDFVILDEFADYPEEFWHAMSPNFAPKDCIVVIISSPPWELEDDDGEPVLFCRIADQWKAREEEAKVTGIPNRYAYVHGSILDNPGIPKEWINEERANLIGMGMEDVWLREYMGQRVHGGGRRIIGTFERDRHVFKHEDLLARIEKDRGILAWLTCVDPSQSAFGVLEMAINPYTKEVYFLDEILERQEDETFEHSLWPRIKAMEDELFPDPENREPERFLRVCDEAAKWWIVGCANDPRIGVAFVPTEKATNSKEFGLSLLRSIFRFDKGYVSDRCQKFIWQLENWRKNKRGEIPKSHDDLIDASRYGLHAGDYYLSSEDLPVAEEIHLRDKMRPKSMAHDLAELAENEGKFDAGYFGGEEDDDIGDGLWH